MSGYGRDVKFLCQALVGPEAEQKLASRLGLAAALGNDQLGDSLATDLPQRRVRDLGDEDNLFLVGGATGNGRRRCSQKEQCR